MSLRSEPRADRRLMNIRFLRGCFPILALLAAVACQSNRSVPPPKVAGVGITPEYVASLPPDRSRPAVEELASELMAAHRRQCDADPEVNWAGCMNYQLLVSLDRYGFLGQHCRDQPDSKSFRQCVFFGRSGVEWLLAIDADPDMDFDWSKPEASHDLALKRLNDVLTERCAGKPEAQRDSCMTTESAKLLGLSDTVGALCSARKEPDQRGACIIDAYDAAMYQAAFAALKL